MSDPNTPKQQEFCYCLNWQEGDDFQSCPIWFPIKAVNDDAAFERLASAMGITLKNGRPTVEDFNKAGGKEFFCGNLQIFPPLTESSFRRVITHRLGDGYKAYIEGIPVFWAHGSSRSEAVGDLVMHHGDELGIVVIQK